MQVKGDVRESRIKQPHLGKRAVPATNNGAQSVRGRTTSIDNDILRAIHADLEEWENFKATAGFRDAAKTRTLIKRLDAQCEIESRRQSHV